MSLIDKLKAKLEAKEEFEKEFTNGKGEKNE